jgi:MoaA/NifB/PqqE/SkfB family radical SAM enzyme
MNSMLAVLARIPLFKIYRRLGFPKLLPINITLSPSPRCNSRCLTCNIWMKRENELTLNEWEKVLESMGNAPYWFTISGGEPFMFKGIVELAQMAYQYNHPGIINIPTNSILSTIPQKVQQIAESCPDSQLIINLSLDGVGEKHDRIRGVNGNFKKFERTLSALLELRDSLPNLALGIHSVVSTFNVKDLDELIDYADQSGADQFITEIAEPRVELDTVGLPITPDKQDYSKAIDKLIAHIENKPYKGIARITEAFRTEYYRFVKRVLDEEDQVISCYAGWASAQIYADGTVWPCCVRADDLGNLRDVDYDFKEIWFGEKIKEVRRSIAAKECHCPLANAAYTTMLHDIPTLTKVGKKLVFPQKEGQTPAPGVKIKGAKPNEG